MTNKKGFTLAEVLITLTIIGVIAAITIPNLMQKWRKHERITQIKTAYSIIQNATKMAISEHGAPDSWSFEDSRDYAPTYFIPFVKIQKNCGFGAVDQYIKSSGCFVDNEKNGTWYALNGTLYDNAVKNGYTPRYYYTIILQNGMQVAIWAPSIAYRNNNIRNLTFIIDVNGQTGPTKLGVDLFAFAFNLDSARFTTKLNAPGDIGNKSETLNDCENIGLGCTRMLELNHWEFPDNYPVKKF